MKKLTILVALTLVVALAVPTYAASFSDVPADHWAYEAVNEIAAAGIIEGYSDGTFKGDNNITRYEIAIVVSRILDNIAEERAALAAEVDSAKSNLSAGEAQDVTAIVKSLMEKNMPEAQEVPESLTDQQADQVTSLIKALTQEYEAELNDLNADVSAVKSDVEDVKADVAELKEDEENIKISGTIDTMFEASGYGDDADEQEAAVRLWYDGDALDDPDPEDYPAEKRFWQELGFNINGNVKDASFDLALTTIYNQFTEEDSISTPLGYVGPREADHDLAMDTALLTVDIKDSTLKLGDLGDYKVENYFLWDEDREGAEVTTSLMGNDVKAFVLGADDDPDTSESELNTADDEYYGVTVSSNLGVATVTGKVYQARDVNADDLPDPVNSDNNEITDFAVALETDLSSDLSVGGEFVANSWDDYTNDDDGSDSLFNINADYQLTDDLKLNGLFEMVGEEFLAPLDDLEESTVDYDKFEVGAEYALDANNTLNGAYTFVQPGDDNYTNDAEDKSVFNIGIDNTTGNFKNNASVEFTTNDGFAEDHDVTLITLGTEYTMNDTTTVTADLVNKNEEKAAGDVVSYNYLKASYDKQLTDNIAWITEGKYITGTVGEADGETAFGEDVDGTSNSLTTKLSVSF